MKKNTKTVFEKLNENNFKVVTNSETMNLYGGLRAGTKKRTLQATFHPHPDVEYVTRND